MAQPCWGGDGCHASFLTLVLPKTPVSSRPTVTDDLTRGPGLIPSVDTTAYLLSRLRGGDDQARDRLLARYRPLLVRWAHRQLPLGARDLLETSDLVQITLTRSLQGLEAFEPRHEGAFLAYLRRILRNLIRDEIRRVRRRPEREPLSEELVDEHPSPLEETLGRDAARRYENALGKLTPQEQEALLMSLEFGCTPHEIAVATGRPSPDAARVFVARALVRLAREMQSDE